jgi:hypothetical protein
MSASTEFPRAGVVARRWRRFEEQLEQWLASPEGRFVVYCAERDRPERAETKPAPAAPA